MARNKRSSVWTRLAIVIVILACGASVDARETEKKSSYAPVDIKEDFSATMRVDLGLHAAAVAVPFLRCR